jgi:hypothetical protein
VLIDPEHHVDGVELGEGTQIDSLLGEAGEALRIVTVQPREELRELSHVALLADGTRNLGPELDGLEEPARARRRIHGSAVARVDVPGEASGMPQHGLVDRGLEEIDPEGGPVHLEPDRLEASDHQPAPARQIEGDELQQGLGLRAVREQQRLVSEQVTARLQADLPALLGIVPVPVAAPAIAQPDVVQRAAELELARNVAGGPLLGRQLRVEPIQVVVAQAERDPLELASRPAPREVVVVAPHPIVKVKCRSST